MSHWHSVIILTATDFRDVCVGMRVEPHNTNIGTGHFDSRDATSGNAVIATDSEHEISLAGRLVYLIVKTATSLTNDLGLLNIHV